jgi:hypothetical protein
MLTGIVEGKNRANAVFCRKIQGISQPKSGRMREVAGRLEAKVEILSKAIDRCLPAEGEYSLDKAQAVAYKFILAFPHADDNPMLDQTPFQRDQAIL